eukprot:226594-Chlamydomonas_euryale.AAC.1
MQRGRQEGEEAVSYGRPAMAVGLRAVRHTGKTLQAPEETWGGEDVGRNLRSPKSLDMTRSCARRGRSGQCCATFSSVPPGSRGVLLIQKMWKLLCPKKPVRRVKSKEAATATSLRAARQAGKAIQRSHPKAAGAGRAGMERK